MGGPAHDAFFLFAERHGSLRLLRRAAAINRPLSASAAFIPERIRGSSKSARRTFIRDTVQTWSKPGANHGSVAVHTAHWSMSITRGHSERALRARERRPLGALRGQFTQQTMIFPVRPFWGRHRNLLFFFVSLGCAYSCVYECSSRPRGRRKTEDVSECAPGMRSSCDVQAPFPQETHFWLTDLSCVWYFHSSIYLHGCYCWEIKLEAIAIETAAH